MSRWLAKEKRLFRTVPVLIIAGIVSLLALSVAYRLYRGKPIFRPNFEQMRFLETWRSGWSHRDALTRLGVARHCLWVAITHNELWVSPHFPFNLFFIPEVFHLDFRIPGKTILEITEGSSGGDRVVTIRFYHATGEEDSFDIAVQDLQGVRKALAAIRSEAG